MVFTFIKNVPSGSSLGKIRLDAAVQKGPGDDLIQVYDKLQLEPHSQQEFLVGQLGKDFSQKELDLVHTYTVVRMVINMYQELLETELSWPNNNKLYLYPFGRTGTGGCFSAEENSIQYYKYAIKNRWVYSCQHFDVVAHEAAHAVINAIKPEWSKDTSQVTASVIEALCDLTALFTKLNNLDWYREINAADQLQSLSSFALDYGSLLGYKDGIRNFMTPRKGTTSHDMSIVFSGSIFRSLTTFSSISSDLNVNEQFDKIKQLFTLCLKGVSLAKTKSIDFRRLAQLMLSLAKENGWHHWEAILRHHFLKEEII